MANDRIYQEPVEAVVLPTSAKAQVAQEPVEAVVLPTNAKARLSQVPVEVVLAPDPPMRVTQSVAEAVYAASDPPTRITQSIVEVVGTPDLVPIRYTQAVVEYVLSPYLQIASDLAVGSGIAIRRLVGSDYVANWLVQDASSISFQGDAFQQDAFDTGISYAGSDLGIEYQVTALGTKDLFLDYGIEDQVVTQVGAELEFGYIIGAPGGRHKDLVFRYRVTKATKRQQRGKNLAFRYRVQKYAQVGKNLALRYRIRVNRVAGAGLGFGYEILPNTGQVGADLGFDAQVYQNVTAGPDLSVDYRVDANIEAGVDAGFTYEVEQPRSRSDLFVDYLLAPPVVSSDLALDYEIQVSSVIPVLGKKKRPGYIVLVDGQKSPFFVEPEYTPPPIPSQVYADLSVSWAIAGVAKTDLGLSYAKAVHATKDLKADWKVARTIRKELPVDWIIRHTYDDNRDLMLTEIDPDLALGMQ